MRFSTFIPAAGPSFCQRAMVSSLYTQSQQRGRSLLVAHGGFEKFFLNHHLLPQNKCEVNIVLGKNEAGDRGSLIFSTCWTRQSGELLALLVWSSWRGNCALSATAICYGRNGRRRRQGFACFEKPRDPSRSACVLRGQSLFKATAFTWRLVC